MGRDNLLVLMDVLMMSRIKINLCLVRRVIAARERLSLAARFYERCDHYYSPLTALSEGIK